MKFEKKIYDILNEATAGGAVGGFVGGKGQYIDDLFAGPFYPSTEAKGVLKDQLSNAKDKIKFSEEITPFQELEMMLVEMEYIYDEIQRDNKNHFVNDTDTMKEVDLDIQYDNPDDGKDKSIFINDTDNYKLVEEK